MSEVKKLSGRAHELTPREVVRELDHASCARCGA